MATNLSPTGKWALGLGALAISVFVTVWIAGFAFKKGSQAA